MFCTDNLHILLVEDTDIIRFCMKELLKAYNCHVSVASSGEEALEKFNLSVDGVLMDIGLPGIDGFQTTRKIREQYPSHSACIYACSAFDREIEDSCIESGMLGFIQKPCQRIDLKNFLFEVNKKNSSVYSHNLE